MWLGCKIYIYHNGNVSRGEIVDDSKMDTAHIVRVADGNHLQAFGATWFLAGWTKNAKMAKAKPDFVVVKRLWQAPFARLYAKLFWRKYE